jgi:hypothetical protein
MGIESDIWLSSRSGIPCDRPDKLCLVKMGHVGFSLANSVNLCGLRTLSPNPGFAIVGVDRTGGGVNIQRGILETSRRILNSGVLEGGENTRYVVSYVFGPPIRQLLPSGPTDVQNKYVLLVFIGAAQREGCRDYLEDGICGVLANSVNLCCLLVRGDVGQRPPAVSRV